VLALEAGAVEDDAVGGELVHRVHRLGAHLALLLRPAKHPLPDPPSSYSLGCCAGRRSARDLREHPIRPWPSRAREGTGRMSTSARRPRLYTQEARRNGIMTGSSPPARPLAQRLTFAAAERKSQQQTSDGMGWDDGGTAQCRAAAH
jgi:hypothetical protein